MFCVSLWAQWVKVTRWKLTGWGWKACPLLSSTTSSPTCQLPLSALLTSCDATEQNCRVLGSTVVLFLFIPCLCSLLFKFDGDCPHNISDLLCTRSSFWNPGIKPACSHFLLFYLLKDMSTVCCWSQPQGYNAGSPFILYYRSGWEAAKLWCTLFTLWRCSTTGYLEMQHVCVFVCCLLCLQWLKDDNRYRYFQKEISQSYWSRLLVIVFIWRLVWFWSVFVESAG